MVKKLAVAAVFGASIVAAWAALPTSVIAAPSGLNLIPTAEVLPKNALSLEMETPHVRGLWNGKDSVWMMTQMGLGAGIEAGIDWSPRDRKAVFNAKARLLQSGKNAVHLTAGVQGITQRCAAQPYAVATHFHSRATLHAGAMRIERATSLIAGASYLISPQCVLQVDYTSGALNSSSAGIACQISDSITVTLAHTVGNSSLCGNSTLLNVSLSCALDRSHASSASDAVRGHEELPSK